MSKEDAEKIAQDMQRAITPEEFARRVNLPFKSKDQKYRARQVMLKVPGAFVIPGTAQVRLWERDFNAWANSRARVAV